MDKYINVNNIKWRKERRECKCHNDVWDEEITIVYKSDIDKMRKADVAPVIHAHWVGSGSDLLCSNCRNKSLGVCDIGYIDKYCRVCGAKMDKKGV